MQATFFTYTADDKSAWFIFQPKWELPFHTQTADLWKTAKPPGTTSPPRGATELITVGKASLTFLPLDKTDRFGQPYKPGTFNATVVQGKSIYKFGDGLEVEKFGAIRNKIKMQYQPCLKKPYFRLSSGFQRM